MKTGFGVVVIPAHSRRYRGPSQGLPLGQPRVTEQSHGVDPKHRVDISEIMKFEIKDSFKHVIFTVEAESLKVAVELALKSGANLRGADLSVANLRGADLGSADLSGADLRGAYLRDANLSVANISGANLRGANLSGADLSGANLRGANLIDANLRGAKELNKYTTTPLYILQDQIGKIRAYKLTKKDGYGPFYSSIKYKVGETYSANADCNEKNCCGEGISLATLDWCIKEFKPGYRIFVAEFTNKDIACIPISSDGKFRVSKCKIVAEKDIKDLGLQ